MEMHDLLFVVVTIGFFFAACAYAMACDRM
jgi:hypothetical protein